MTSNPHEHLRAPLSILRFLPPFSGLPLGPLLTLSLRSLARRRPGLFERLGEFGKARFLIDPIDLPFTFHVVPDGSAALVRAAGRSGEPPSDVVIRGPILLLLGILDGTLDGDALFFHRAISVSGRTEAVVALRNAIEDAELRPSDLLGLKGTAARLADSGILGGLSFARQIATGAHRRERTQP
ncbi:ubiquinone anaerobic biosynthesis accessory factor UbiT [Aquamicrobium defluvii]|uniref:Lipid carrier n=1 Tax=Aquamicrobium defluvii TaxID=69279 RepID=A0A011UBC5_9HYPH|nr:SCP2 sterol-binding domain-containing protein [Aquamicrobium defluvii]EXL03233.1 lipid carrier [Aquamicrobium defluvii]EZQ13520.1 lipid carrier [Halopseudomonas bauzanensis]TDR33670.1 putative lipid carrier protein YhbT [Aquamicrobium defluvii]